MTYTQTVKIKYLVKVFHLGGNDIVEWEAEKFKSLITMRETLLLNVPVDEFILSQVIASKENRCLYHTDNNYLY